MATKQNEPAENHGVSKLQIAVGAASLFLFIVGLKRSFQVDDAKSNGIAAPPRPAQSGARRAAQNAAK